MKIIDLLRSEELDGINKLIKNYDKNDEFEVSLFSNKEACLATKYSAIR